MLGPQRIVIAIAGSIALHAVVLLNISRTPPPEPVVRQTAQVDFTLIAQAPPAETPETEPPQDKQPPLKSPPINPPTVQPATIEPVKTPVAESDPSAVQLVRELRKTLTIHGKGEALTAFRSAPCPPNRSKARAEKCQDDYRPPSDPQAAQLSQLVANLVQPTMAQRPTFDQDMARVKLLANQASKLNALDSDDPLQLALAREQRATIRDEIMRIDARHESVNLLRIFPMAKRVVYGLKDGLKEVASKDG